MWCISDKDDADVLGLNCFYAPVVKVVGQATIAGLKHEFFFDQSMLEYFGHVEYIKIILFRQYETVLHQYLHSLRVVVLYEVIVGVCSVYLVVVWVLENGGVKCIEGNKVRHLAVFFFNNVRVNHFLSGDQVMSNFFFCELDMDLVIFRKMLVQGKGYCWDIRIHHRSQVRCIGLLRQTMLLNVFGEGHICRLEGKAHVN